MVSEETRTCGESGEELCLVLSGWQPRYFVLNDQGVLAYYKSSELIHEGCKGSCLIVACELKGDSSASFSLSDRWSKGKIRPPRLFFACSSSERFASF